MKVWQAAGILAGYLADAIVGDPRRGHPVAGFGRVAGALEPLTYRDNRAAGAVHTGLLVAGVTVAASVARRRVRAGPGVAALTAFATWVALGGTTLLRTGSELADALEAGGVDAARALLPSLCGRDPAVLDAAGLCRAALESVAENTSDAAVAPLLWAAVAGAPGVLAYRAVNTLDAMIGHRSPHYARFGWAAARLDDAANLIPARVTGMLTALCAPVVGGSPGAALRAWRSDAARHPSPNAGVAEAAFAGALGVRLGGPTQYRHQLEIRPTLGAGREPDVADLRRAIRLARWVQNSAVVIAVVVSAAGRTGRRVSPRR
ncbi:MAG TPA: cobalamin biosynthesis protein [Mycobacterium sp.]|nr:cobalamin biosynthesis protein [Mycobacterium sp.]